MQMLKEQLAKGNNGLIKRKFITFGIEADDMKAARQKPERIEADILGNFKALGVAARPLSGLERLELLHGSLNPLLPCLLKNLFRLNSATLYVGKIIGFLLRRMQ